MFEVFAFDDGVAVAEERASWELVLGVAGALRITTIVEDQ